MNGSANLGPSYARAATIARQVVQKIGKTLFETPLPPIPLNNPSGKSTAASHLMKDKG
jgi:hypothetical protein